MANSYQRATSDGTMTFIDISIDYLDRSEISVYFDDILTTTWSWSGTEDKRILFSSAVPNGTVVEVRRITDASQLRHEFSGGAAFTAKTLDEDLKQALHMAQEANEANLVGDFFTDINMHGFRVYNIGTAVDDSDALTLGQYKADVDGVFQAKEDAEAAAEAAEAAATAADGAAQAATDALRVELLTDDDADKGSGMVAHNTLAVYTEGTVGGALRTFMYLNDSVTDTTGTTPVHVQVNAAITAAVSRGVSTIYGELGSTYLIRDKIDLTPARNLVMDFRGATVIDDVRTFRGDLGGRGDHLFRMYASVGVEVKNLTILTAATRAILNTGAPSCTFWIGGQSEGNEETTWSRVTNVKASTPITGQMFIAICGEARGVHINGVTLTGRWSYGVDIEYGGIPVDPAINNTITNGKHPYNILVEDFNGYDLIDCRGFLRTAAGYNIRFLNCQGSNVRNFIYGYVGDRNISRFSQNAVFENCKSKGESTAYLEAANYDVTIVSVNKDGSTLAPLPAFTNYRHFFRFVNCEFQTGIRTDNASVRFFGTQGKAVFEQCLFRDTYLGLRAEPSTNPDYNSKDSLTFRDCVFVNCYRFVQVQGIHGIVFNNTRFEDQNNSSALSPLRLTSSMRPTFENCQFTGKAEGATQYFIELVGCADVGLYRNLFTLNSVEHYAVHSPDSTMTGRHNMTNGLLTNRDVTYFGIVGEQATLNRDLDQLVGGVLTYEKGTNFECGSTAQSLGRVIGGKVGDTITFRGISVATAVTFRHSVAGVATTERLLNKALADSVMSGNAVSRTYMKLNSGWWEL